MQKEKKQFIIYMVMLMKEYINLPRLMTGDKIGNRHIVVEKHISTDYPLHWHNYFEIEIIIDGTGSYVFNGTAYSISKGDAYLLTPVDFHKIEASSPVELINISFDEMWLSENMRTLLYSTNFTKMRRFDKYDYERLLMAAELLRHECETDALCINQLLEYLLSRFVQCEILQQSETVANQPYLSGIKEAVAYIELHFREKITLQQISGISGYNPTYFSELFRKIIGETYIERLTSLRINYAKALLTSGLSVSDACFESGFGSLSNFLVAFKAKCGMSPSEYRKKHKELL